MSALNIPIFTDNFRQYHKDLFMLNPQLKSIPLDKGTISFDWLTKFHQANREFNIPQPSPDIEKWIKTLQNLN